MEIKYFEKKKRLSELMLEQFKKEAAGKKVDRYVFTFKFYAPLFDKIYIDYRINKKAVDMDYIYDFIEAHVLSYENEEKLDEAITKVETELGLRRMFF